MTYSKRYDNGLRLVIEKMEGLFSVSTGVLVNTGSAYETQEENGISHFIEHCVFKGTKTRSAFEISDYIDRIGASINAYTSKEITCYYTKSTSEHAKETLEVLSDLIFNSTFLSKELKKEKGVILEEINMSEDSPEDILFDLLAESFYGKEGLGRTILGPKQNIRAFSKKDILNYMDKYYTPDNVVISIAGNVDVAEMEKLVEEYFASKFENKKCNNVSNEISTRTDNLYRYKKIEQTHIGLALPAFKLSDDRCDALSLANIILGGGMSSRLFQKIREEYGLCYSIYSYISSYKSQGILEVYAGVNTSQKNKAFLKIVEEIKKLKSDGITEQEFLRGKEQIKSAFIMGRESSSTQMQLFGKYMLYFNKEFDIKEKLNRFDKITKLEVEDVINQAFDLTKMSTATVGTKKQPLTQGLF